MLRTCQHLLRGTALQNTASTHQQHLIAKRQRIDPIMRDDNGGNADRAKKFGKLRTHVIARGRVQRGKRLVEEQQAGFSRENARDLFTGRELGAANGALKLSDAMSVLPFVAFSNASRSGDLKSPT